MRSSINGASRRRNALLKQLSPYDEMKARFAEIKRGEAVVEIDYSEAIVAALHYFLRFVEIKRCEAVVDASITSLRLGLLR